MRQSAKQKTSQPGDLLRHVPLTFGEQKVLVGLARGRAIAIQNARTLGAMNAELVMVAALRDLNAGGPARGRPKRIAIDLGSRLTERSVLRILDRLLVCPIPLAHNVKNSQEAFHAK